MSQSHQVQLAESIVIALIENGLLTEDKKEKVCQEIAAGNLNREDWSLLFELSAAQEDEGQVDG